MNSYVWRTPSISKFDNYGIIDVVTIFIIKLHESQNLINACHKRSLYFAKEANFVLLYIEIPPILKLYLYFYLIISAPSAGYYKILYWNMPSRASKITG